LQKRGSNDAGSLAVKEDGGKSYFSFMATYLLGIKESSGMVSLFALTA